MLGFNDYELKIEFEIRVETLYGGIFEHRFRLETYNSKTFV